MRRAVGSYGTPTNETLYRTADSLTRRHLQQWWDNFPPTELQGFLGAIVPPKTVPRRYSFHLAARAASSRVKVHCRYHLGRAGNAVDFFCSCLITTELS